MWSASAASTIEGSLNAILSALGLLEKPENTLRDQVALGLIRSEALRASRLLQGLRLLSGDRPLVRRPLDFGALLSDVLSESEDERAFLAIALDCSVEEPCSIRADRELLSMAVAGGIVFYAMVIVAAWGFRGEQSSAHTTASARPFTRSECRKRA